MITGIIENALGSNRISIVILKKRKMTTRGTSFSPDIVGRGPRTTLTTIEATAINSNMIKTSQNHDV